MIDAQIVSKLMSDKPFQQNWNNVKFDGVPLAQQIPDNLLSGNSLLGGNYLASGKTTSGEWVDVVLLKHWLTWAFEKRISQTFFDSRKITNPNVLENVVANTLEAAKILGGIRRYRVGQATGSSEITINWKAQLSGAINNATISGTVEP